MRQFELIGGLLKRWRSWGWGVPGRSRDAQTAHVPSQLDLRRALVTATATALFRVMAQAMAEPLGWPGELSRPKPFPQLHRAAGAHLHHSLWGHRRPATSFTTPAVSSGLSPLAYHFLAGVLEHAPGPWCASPIPQPESYARARGPDHQVRRHLVAGLDPSYGRQQRSHMVRIPDDQAPGTAPGR